MTETAEKPKTIAERMAEAGLTKADIHLPAGGVAVFGRTGSGKSSMFYNSEFIDEIIIADTGSMAHKLYAKRPPFVVDTTSQKSPIQQVSEIVERWTKEGIIGLIDSWTTLQEAQVAWFKRGSSNSRGPAVSLKDHNTIVGHLRDLALVLAQAQVFTIMNTAPGGRGKNPDGQEVIYPAGCVTGYPSLNGTNANSETVLARWGSVWGCFPGFRNGDKEIPRGLYVPSHDIRPAEHSNYSPLKDPLRVIRDTSGGKGIMVVPDATDPANHGRCFVDELLLEASIRWPKRKPAASPPATTTTTQPAAATSPAAQEATKGRK